MVKILLKRYFFGVKYGINGDKIFFPLSQPFADIYRKIITQCASPITLGIDTNKYLPAYLMLKSFLKFIL
jgi:hypothetical protein